MVQLVITGKEEIPATLIAPPDEAKLPVKIVLDTVPLEA
jgi:hypothetical protein